MPDSLPLPNDPASRTDDGTLKNASTLTPIPAQTSSTSPEPSTNDRDPAPGPDAKPADPATPKPDAPVVPDTYTFAAPEGQTADETLVSTFSPVFRELGLTQAQADKLVEAYNKHAMSQAETTAKAIETMGKTWEAQWKADPFLGPNEEKVSATIGRAVESTLTPAERAAFAKAMNETQVGNHPDFIRAFYKLAERVGPGTHVPGGGPSPNGQAPAGKTERPPLGHGAWANLPKAS